MNEPKLAPASVDSERVIRDLLDAFKSLKTSTAPAPFLQPKEQEPHQQSAAYSETPNDQIDDQRGQYGIIEAFCKDHKTVERLEVTREELQALSDTSLLGTLTCKQDVLFILRQTGASREQRTSARTERVPGSGEGIELSDFRYWAEHIRRESMARLSELDASNDIDQLGPLDRPLVLALGVVLMTMVIAISVEMC